MKPWLIAHRGANNEAPENSKSAFDRALKYPVDGMEFDLQMTADNQLVLYHDATLFKIIGKRNKISDFSIEELRRFHWGGKFSVFVDEPLLTLRKTLELYASRTRLMVEIKSTKFDRSSGRSKKMVLKVLEELERPEIKEFIENIFILSFDPNVLKEGFQNAPHFKYVLNLSDKPYDPTGYKSIMDSPESETDHLYALCVACKNLSHPLAEFSDKQGLSLMTYVCNSPKQTRRAIGFGVDVIMTDKPGWLTSFFNRGK
jgi:glycerophosphoryl diester phosphodiesterase